MIYFMQAPEGGPVKIGFSDDVDARRRQLESHYGRPLLVLRTMEGDREHERSIHSRLAASRLGRTEQFRPSPEVMGFIGLPLFADPNPEATEAMPSFGLRLVAIKCSEGWADWIGRYARQQRLSVSSLVDRCLEEFAQAEGFEAPPGRLP